MDTTDQEDWGTGQIGDTKLSDCEIVHKDRQERWRSKTWRLAFEKSWWRGVAEGPREGSWSFTLPSSTSHLWRTLRGAAPPLRWTDQAGENVWKRLAWRSSTPVPGRRRLPILDIPIFRIQEELNKSRRMRCRCGDCGGGKFWDLCCDQVGFPSKFYDMFAKSLSGTCLPHSCTLTHIKYTSLSISTLFIWFE